MIKMQELITRKNKKWFQSIVDLIIYQGWGRGRFGYAFEIAKNNYWIAYNLNYGKIFLKHLRYNVLEHCLVAAITGILFFFS